MNKKLIEGVGINDANFPVKTIVDGKPHICKIYDTWRQMLVRCYNGREWLKRPNYKGCSVAEEWFSFMKFRGWVLEQDYKNKQLDKDLLVHGNKIYSKDTCAFITKDLNSFMTDRSNHRGDLPLGVNYVNKSNKFVARCNDPFKKDRVYLGSFDMAEEAHLAWKTYKHELAIKYAKLETDPRIIKALHTRYLIE